MRWMLGLTLVLSSMGAQAAWDGTGPDWGLNGNDTGGIIQWTPEIAHSYRSIAAAHCAHFSRIAAITSVHARYGDYVGFRCLTDRRWDPRKAWYSPCFW
jgi:hypothetical protein